MQLYNKENFLEKKSDLYLMKIQINFEFRKKSDLYLMKIHISFVSLKKIRFEKYRSVFELAKIISVFNENTDQF